MQNLKRAQSTFDYLVLTGVILVVIVPLLFFSTERIDQNRVVELQDALAALKDGITQVNNLGFGTSSVVVLRVPKGVVEQRVGISETSGGSVGWCKKGMLCYKIAGNDMTVTVPADVEGILPINEGLHYVQLFNNGTHVLLYECGNNRREAFEQCDGRSPPGGTGDDSACGTALGCASPSHPQACKCFCSSNSDCARSTGLCGANGVCVPCATDDQCVDNTGRRTGQVCLGGQCVDPNRQCLTNRDCTYPNTVCNRRSGFCEPCDFPPPTPQSFKDCDPGHICLDNTLPSRCGTPPVNPNNNPPVVNAGVDQTITLPINQISLDGTVTDDGLPNPPGLFTISQTTGLFTIRWTKQNGPGTVTFGNNQMVDTTATFSRAGAYTLRLTADDSAAQRFDELTVNVRCAANTHCNYPNEVCVSGNCLPCTFEYQCTAPDNWCDAGVCRTRGGGTPCSSNVQCTNPSNPTCNLRTTTCESCSVPSLPRSVKACGSAFACRLSTGRCEPFGGGPLCGNDLFEPGEQCEQATHCEPQAGMTASCTNCLCGYTLDGVGRNPGSPRPIQ